MSSRLQEKEAARRARLEAEEAEAAKAKRVRRIRILAGVLAVAVVAVVLAVVLSGSGDKGGKVKAGGGDVAALFDGIPASGLELGRRTAPVTLEEFVDPQCPYCMQFSKDALPTVVRDYVRPGKVRLVLRPLAFIGQDSVTAARAVLGAARQDKAWPFLDVLYANQGPENSGYVTDAFLRRIGNAVPGLNVDQALKAGDSASATQTLQQTQARATAVGANSTPTLILHQGASATGKGQTLTLDANDYAGSITQALDAALAQ